MKLFRSLALASLALAPFYSQAQLQLSKPTDKYFEISKNLEIFSNIFKELNESYVDPIQPGKMIKEGVDEMLYNLDPYTNFYTEADKEDAESMTTGKYGGIGSSLRVNDSLVQINAVFEGSPVDKAGVKAGDILLKVDNISTKGKSDEEIGLLLKGAAGTKVVLELQNPNTKAISSKTIERGTIDIGAVPLYKLIGKNSDVAYVYLSQFTQGCSTEIKNALDEMKTKEPNLKGVVLDLRGNPGGLLGEAVKIVNLFVPADQIVVSVKGKNPAADYDQKTTGKPWDTQIPLAVLINHGSASASEVVSGTIQDLDRGVIVGNRSFGKGLVQVVKPLGYNTALKLTIAKYYTPSGRCIQALDYTHRNGDGSVSKVADSLKRSFPTKTGRRVYDGGGIEPDLVTKDFDVNQTLIALLSDGQIFDYATDYYYKHPSIETAEKFFVSDTEYENFMKWMEEKKYVYESRSEQLLTGLTEMLKEENRLDENQTAIAQLKQSIKDNKKKEMQKSKEDIKLLLSNEIVSRYYYQKGRVVNRLYHDDEELNLALKTLANPTGAYAPILRPK